MVHLAQDRSQLERSVNNVNKLSGRIKDLEFLVLMCDISFSNKTCAMELTQNPPVQHRPLQTHPRNTASHCSVLIVVTRTDFL